MKLMSYHSFKKSRLIRQTEATYCVPGQSIELFTLSPLTVARPA